MLYSSFLFIYYNSEYKNKMGVVFMFGEELSLQFKLIKHLGEKNDLRVRDYIIHIRKEFPNLQDCPVDISLIKKSIDFLREKGWTVDLGAKVEKPAHWIYKK